MKIMNLFSLQLICTDKKEEESKKGGAKEMYSTWEESMIIYIEMKEVKGKVFFVLWFGLCQRKCLQRVNFYFYLKKKTVRNIMSVVSKVTND